MIWYLLYPFRGTTDPPKLGPAHPLRRTFTQYGREAARHPVITLLISVAVAAILIYPFPYLYTNDFTNGSSNLPHRVWTAAQPFEGAPNTLPDVVMRSVWVHGSYMEALDRKVIQAALEIQDELLGPTIRFNPSRAPKNLWTDDFTGDLTLDVRDSLHAINGLGNQSWFFHSPLLYWSCSSEAIANDKDIITTVNEGSRLASSVNVTLRHSIVFSGKRFEDRDLVAADALVITLLYKSDSPVAREWERKAESLARKGAGKWRVYPQDGRVVTSQLYEFRFQPLSFQDDMLLGLAYGLTLVYFLLSLTKLRALKSRFGLSVTVVVQIALSIVSSFTICAVFNIDLSKIPREAYPLVVLTVGLENIFRLINAVIVTPSESPTALRIAEALGQTGHIALAGVAQNLVILWLLGKFVSPGVASFCFFAAIALTFDFLYLLTFFVAVLSVEVRRTELSDSLDRGGHRPKHKTHSDVRSKHTWVDAVLHGDIPISTRISGSIVMIGFVLIAQWHFFDHESPLDTGSRLLRLIWVDREPPNSHTALLLDDVNQARTPTAWLRLQDHETAREVIQVIKPNAYSYIARVYDPLVFVLSGSDRNSSQGALFLPAVYDFIKHQTTRFTMTVLFIVAAVSLLMNFLLWGEEDVDLGEYDNRADDDPLLAVKTLKGHALDVAMITATPEGVLVSVGLDRWIRVWDIRQDITVHAVETFNRNVDLFPILAIAVDDRAIWLALLCGNGQVMLWSIAGREWGPCGSVETNRRSPLLFVFSMNRTDSIPSILMVQSNAVMSEIRIVPGAAPVVTDLRICKATPLYVRSNFEAAATALGFIAVSRHGSLHFATQLQDNWVVEEIELKGPESEMAILSVCPISALKGFLAIRKDAIDLVDVETRTILHTFQSIKSQPSTVQCFHSTRRTPFFGSNGLASFSIVYTEQESGDCILRTYCPTREDEVLCMDYRKCPQEQPYCSWENAIVQIHRTELPGKWDVLPIGVVIGVRKRQIPASPINGYGYGKSNLPSTRMRHRGHISKRPSISTNNEDEDLWETWILSAEGEKTSTSLHIDEINTLSDGQLLVSSCGPMNRVGQRSIAVGLGNVIKVISVGHERFTVEESSDDMALAMAGRRRKVVATRKRSYGS